MVTFEIMTTKGCLPIAALERKQTVEAVPCGSCITTQYFLKDELVRQDVEIHVKTGLVGAGETGRV